MLFRKKIERSCVYCTHGLQMDESQVLCCKKGIRSLPSKCLGFRYDPTKRVPLKAKAVDFKKYDNEDYSL